VRSLGAITILIFNPALLHFMIKPIGVCEDSLFEQVFRENARALHNFLYYRCGNQDLAEDLTQESFLKLWKECANVPLEKARGFLYSVARNLFLDHLRHEKVVLRFQQMEPVNQFAQTPDALAEGEELQKRIEQAISQLPENQRLVFLMNRMDNMTYQEIAEHLGLSVKAVEKRMHGALMSLRAVVEK
jgi:RNA polymerase sigma-70 factor (family 1)